MPILSMVLFTRALGLEYGTYLYQATKDEAVKEDLFNALIKIIMLVFPVFCMYDFMMLSFESNFDNSQDILLEQNFV